MYFLLVFSFFILFSFLFIFLYASFLSKKGFDVAIEAL